MVPTHPAAPEPKATDIPVKDEIAATMAEQPKVPKDRRPEAPPVKRIEKTVEDMERLDLEERAGLFAPGTFQVGTRSTFFSLLRGTKDSFLGTINELKEVQNGLPIRLFVDWFFTPTWGVELTWDSLKVQTWTQEGYTDGDFTLKGPMISFIGRYENSSQWTPYGSVGLAYFQADFEYDTAWQIGYDNAQHWAEYGFSPTPYRGRIRNMDLSNPIGVLLNAGCEYKFSEAWSADIFLRLTYVEVKDHCTVTEYGVPWRDVGTENIPLSNYAIGLGIRYSL